MPHVEIVRRQAGLTAEMDTNPDYEGWTIKHHVKLITFDSAGPGAERAEELYDQIMNDHDPGCMVIVEDRVPHFFKDSENVKLLVFYKVLIPNMPPEDEDEQGSIQEALEE